MKLSSSGFATILLLTMLMPLSSLLFNLWRSASTQHELVQERQRFYQEMNHLELVAQIMLKQLKKEQVLIWQNLDRLVQPLALPCTLSIDCSDQNDTKEKKVRFQVLLDHPVSCHDQQIRLQVKLLGHDQMEKRSISCLISRQLKPSSQKERYVLVVDYFTQCSTL